MTSPVNLRLMRAIADGESAATVPALVETFGRSVTDVVARVHGLIADGFLSRRIGDESLRITRAGKMALKSELEMHAFERPSRLPSDLPRRKITL